LSTIASGETRKDLALVIADFDIYGGTGAYLKRLLAFLAERYRIHFCFRPGERGGAIKELLIRMNCGYSTDFGMPAGLDWFTLRIAQKLGVSHYFEFLRDSAIRFYLERRYHPRLFVISQGGRYSFFAFLKSKLPVLMVTHSLFTSSILEERGGEKFISKFSHISTKNKAICMVSIAAQSMFTRNIHSAALSTISRCIPNYGVAPIAGGARRNDRTIVILTMGHFASYKNPTLWLAVAKELVGRFAGRIRFIWAGRGTMLENLREDAKPYPAIEFPGFVEDSASLYLSADIYFQPSIVESQGIAVVEAMAAGLPCVVSRAGGLPESIEHGVEGFLCDIHATEQYIESLSRIIEDPSLRARLGTNAKLKYLRCFSKARWEENMNALLHDLLPN